MANILFNSNVTNNTIFISILDIFLKRGHNCLLVGKTENSVLSLYIGNSNFNFIYLNFENNNNDSLILYELSKFYDYGISYNNNLFVNYCYSKFRISLINDSLEQTYYNYKPSFMEQRSYKDKLEEIYYTSISGLYQSNIYHI